MNQFDKITLNNMDRVKLMNRVDTKFAIPFAIFPKLLDKLKTQYYSLEIKGTRTPFYKSLYFDTKDFNMYYDHHNGRGNRYKIRIRNYTESNLFFLELKHKFKGRTDKNRIEIQGFETELSDESLAFLNLKIKGKYQLNATLWNSFNRITLVHKFDNERLTLDFNLNYEWKDNKISKSQLVIAELKQERVNRNSDFFRLMKENYIRPYRISKYCVGTIEIYNHLKHNLFKSKLLKLKNLKK